MKYVNRVIKTAIWVGAALFLTLLMNYAGADFPTELYVDFFNIGFQPGMLFGMGAAVCMGIAANTLLSNRWPWAWALLSGQWMASQVYQVVVRASKYWWIENIPFISWHKVDFFLGVIGEMSIMWLILWLVLYRLGVWKRHSALLYLIPVFGTFTACSVFVQLIFYCYNNPWYIFSSLLTMAGTGLLCSVTGSKYIDYEKECFVQNLDSYVFAKENRKLKKKLYHMVNCGQTGHETLLVVGGAGSGKTYLGSCLKASLMATDTSCTVVDMNELVECIYEHLTDPTDYTGYNQYLSSQVLIIDNAETIGGNAGFQLKFSEFLDYLKEHSPSQTILLLENSNMTGVDLLLSLDYTYYLTPPSRIMRYNYAKERCNECGVSLPAKKLRELAKNSDMGVLQGRLTNIIVEMI